MQQVFSETGEQAVQGRDPKERRTNEVSPVSPIIFCLEAISRVWGQEVFGGLTEEKRQNGV